MASKPKITTFLWFDNNAEEAMEFYTAIFKHSKILSVSRYGEAVPARRGRSWSAPSNSRASAS